MADRKIELNLTAKDQASKVVDDVADSVDDLEKHDAVEIEVGADTSDADRELGDVESTAERLERTDWIVQVRADIDQAQREAADLQADLDDLEHPVDVDVDVDTHAAVNQLGDLESAAGDATTKVTGVGGAPSIGALRDLLGPMGDVSTQAGEMGESFEAAGATIGTQMGLSQEAVGRLGTALGVGGAVFGAVFGFWQMFQKQAEAARDAARDVQTALAAGDVTEASRKIVDGYGKQITEAKRYGLSLQDVVGFLTGASDKIGRYSADLGASADPQQRANALMETFGDLSANQALGLQGLITQLDEARSTYDDVGDSLAETQRRQFETTKAIGGTTDALLEQARVAVPAVREEILRYVAAQEGIPESKITTILTDLDPNDAAQVEAEIDELARARKVVLSFDWAGIAAAQRAISTGLSSTTVTVNMPRGARFDPTTRAQVNRYTRRNGGRGL